VLPDIIDVLVFSCSYVFVALDGVSDPGEEWDGNYWYCESSSNGWVVPTPEPTAAPAPAQASYSSYSWTDSYDSYRSSMTWIYIMMLVNVFA